MVDKHELPRKLSSTTHLSKGTVRISHETEQLVKNFNVIFFFEKLFQHEFQATAARFTMNLAGKGRLFVKWKF